MRSLREEDLQVGKPFVHPESRLEYEDFHAYLLGKDPIPHWRNARIKGLNGVPSGKTSTGSFYPSKREGESCEQYRERCIEKLVREYDRDGDPFIGPKYFDFNSRTSSTLPWR